MRRRDLIPSTVPTAFKTEWEEVRNDWWSGSTMMQNVYSDDPERQLEGIERIRKCVQMALYAGQIVRSGIVSRFAKILTSPNLDLQRETARLIGEIACNSFYTASLLTRAGVVTGLINLLSSPLPDIQEPAAWALVQNLKLCPEIETCILEDGGFLLLLELLQVESQSTAIMRSAATAVYLFCIGYYRDFWEIVSPAFHVMTWLVKQGAEDEVLSTALRTVGVLSTPSPTSIATDIQLELFPQIVQCLIHPDLQVQASALYAVERIIMSSSVRALNLLEAGLLPAFQVVLSPRENSYRIGKDVCPGITRILVSDRASILFQRAIEARLFRDLTDIFYHATDYLKNEAFVAICMAVSRVSELTPAQVRSLLDQGCIQPLYDSLGSAEWRDTQASMQGLYELLKVGRMDFDMAGKKANRYATSIEAGGGLEGIHRLSCHPSWLIRKWAVSIIEEFF